MLPLQLYTAFTRVGILVKDAAWSLVEGVYGMVVHCWEKAVISSYHVPMLSSQSVDILYWLDHAHCVNIRELVQLEVPTAQVHFGCTALAHALCT